MKLHINYANLMYYNAQKKNSETAKTIGGCDESIMCGIKDIDTDYYTKNRRIFSFPRGAGYWIWKPYIIKKYLKTLSECDYLIYTDSGTEFVSDINYLLEIKGDILEKQGFLISGATMPVPSGPPWADAPEYMWTKRDAFILTETDIPEITKTPQACTCFMMFKPKKEVFDFLEEWIYWNCDYRAVTDSENVLGKNYDGWVEHRHDQSLASILAKKRKWEIISDITHWAEGRRDPKIKTVLFQNRIKY